MIKSRSVFIFFILLLFALSGCENEDKTIKEIHQHLEETVQLEKGFEDVQQPILDAEKAEQTYYEEIIKLSLEDYDQIKELSDKAIESANNRKKLLETEKESIDTANKEFILVQPLIDKLKNEELKKKSENLVEKMKERVDSYKKLNEEYNKGIDGDIKLYELLQKKDVTINELEDHIDKLNTQYESIMKAKDEFNNKTDAYNESKKAFYKTAGLDVTIENDK